MIIRGKWEKSIYYGFIETYMNGTFTPERLNMHVQNLFILVAVQAFIMKTNMMPKGHKHTG